MSAAPLVLAKDVPPELTGQLGAAWKYDVAAVDARYPGGPPPELAVASWCVKAPYAHPIWSFYIVGCISLRPVEGLRPAKINLDGATHEVFVFALNPDHEPALNDRPKLLTPGNFIGQFIEPSDEAAAARIQQTVQDVIDGRLNPDTDHMQHWIRRFSASNIKGDPKRAGETRIVIDHGKGAPPVELVIPPHPAPQDMH